MYIGQISNLMVVRNFKCLKFPVEYKSNLPNWYNLIWIINLTDCMKLNQPNFKQSMYFFYE